MPSSGGTQRQYVFSGEALGSIHLDLALCLKNVEAFKCHMELDGLVVQSSGLLAPP